MTFEFELITPDRNCMVDITAQLREAIRKSGLENGAVIVYVPHTTAAITINEGADPDVKRDIQNFLDKTIPHRGDYHHNEGNSDAHIKSTLVGVDRFIPVRNSAPLLGIWQSLFFCEFDGPRTRKFFITPIFGGER
jgi:secondary thiamine-phosphate synthase enzyme